MEYKICLSYKTLLFYSILLPIVAFASLSNLIGIINNTNQVTGFGVFSLFGFIVLPILIIAGYRNNLCKINALQVRIGKEVYPRDAYKFAIEEYTLPFKERPLFSLHRKVYSRLTISRNSGGIVQSHDLDVSKKSMHELRQHLSI